MRLQKFMADAGVASRRKCEELIKQGDVTVNGEIATLGISVVPTDDIRLNGKKLCLAEKHVVIMLNKPRGVVSTASDPQGRRTTQEYFANLEYRVYNIGRLDIDSEGLLLFTNDGELANRLTHPSHEVSKTYRLLVQGKLSASSIEKLKKGVMLDDGLTSPAKVFGVKEAGENGENTSLFISIHEGRNRQVRRMMDAVGHNTLRLRRVAVGELRLNALRAGEWRYLTDKEIELL
ncbi:MAG: rRNA pseudouridine synthase [Clostridiales bacterium]|nr:rRNA pseudouridine synthase [Clostridiales bacterium]